MVDKTVFCIQLPMLSSITFVHYKIKAKRGIWKKIKLNNGIVMPILGFGESQITDQSAKKEWLKLQIFEFELSVRIRIQSVNMI
jgi:hypothetical protein